MSSDNGPNSYPVWRSRVHPDDLAEFDAQWSSAPYDEVLDALMTSRGWWSRRREVQLYDKDFVFDSWMWGPYLDEVLVQCVGDGEYEVHWNEKRGVLTQRVERLKKRQAVIDRLDYLEGLRTRVEPRY
jgi:hypothetical protein